jgi:hypothetical protein
MLIDQGTSERESEAAVMGLRIKHKYRGVSAGI